MKYKNIYGVITFAIVLCWALWNYKESLWLLGKFYAVIKPFVIGLSLAFIVNVMMVQLEHGYTKLLPMNKASRFCRPVCLVLSLAIITAFLAFTVMMVIPQLHDSVRTLIKTLPSAVDSLNVFLKQKTKELYIYSDLIQWVQQHANEWYKTIIDYLQSNKSVLLNRTMNATASIVDLVADFVIGIVASIYLLLEKEKNCRSLKRMVYAFCSKERADYLLYVGNVADRIFTGFVSGQVVEVLILGLLYFIGMLLCGFPYAFTISVLVAVLGLIPLIGTFISFIIGCFLILVAAPAKIWLFCLFFFVLQRIEGDLLYPKIVGKAVGLSELWVLIAVTIGASLGGILGMIISVPLCSVVYTLLAQKVKGKLEKKNLQDL